MKQWFSRFRIFGFPVILFILALVLYLLNRQSVPVLDSVLFTNTDKNVILGLYQAANYIYLFTRPLIPATFYPFLLLFVGMVGIFQLLNSFTLFTNRYLPFIGSVFYALNIGTFWFFSYVSLPLMFLFALFPWQIWILFQIMKGSTLSRGKKLIAFFLIQLAAAPIYSYPGSFTFFLAVVGILCFSMIFSRSIFRVMTHGPLYILFIVLLNLYWFLPRMYLLLDSNKTVAAFKDAVNQTLQVITYPQFMLYVMRQPGLIIAIQGIFVVIIFLGVLRLTRYHVPFLVTSLALSLPFWLKLPVDIPELKSFLASISLPGVIFFLIAGAFFFVNGLNTMLEIYSFFHKKVRKERSHHAISPLQAAVKSPFELYQEIVQATHDHHPHHQFTPLQFTEHFLHHLLQMKTQQASHADKRKHLEVRYLCYAVFLLLVISGITAFQGKYFTANTGSFTQKQDDARITALLGGLSPERKAIMSQYTSELEHALATEDDSVVRSVFDKYGIQKDNPVQVFQNVPNIGPLADGVQTDYVFSRHGNYLTSDAQPFDAYYPFRVVEGSSFSAHDKNTILTQEIQQNLMKRLGDYDLESATESAQVSVVTSKGQSLSFESSPYVDMSGDKLTFNFESRPIEAIKPEQFKSVDCQDGVNTECYVFDHQGLEHQYGYLITVTSKSKTPDILPFAIEDLKHSHTYFEGRIDSTEQNIVLPPSYVHGVGYSFMLNSAHYQDWTIHISYLPFTDIQNVRFIGRNGLPTSTAGPHVEVKEINSSQYQIQTQHLESPKTLVLALYQDNDDGWKAYKVDSDKVHSVIDLFWLHLYPFNYVKEIGSHSAFNSWANGWQLNSEWENSTILLIFWPQYLEYAGFAIVAAFFIVFAGIRFQEWYTRLRD